MILENELNYKYLNEVMQSVRLVWVDQFYFSCCTDIKYNITDFISQVSYYTRWYFTPTMLVYPILYPMLHLITLCWLSKCHFLFLVASLLSIRYQSVFHKLRQCIGIPWLLYCMLWMLETNRDCFIHVQKGV